MGLLVAVGNLKGGVGKSTLAVNLASAFAAGGRSTVLVDTDPQQTAARWAAHRLLPCQVLEAPIRDLAGAGAWVGYADGIRRKAELVVVDLPAVLGAALAAACLLADAVLIPTGLGRVDLTTLQRTLHHLRAARRERRGSAPLALIVPTRLPPPGLLRRRIDLRALADLGEPLAPPLHLDPAFEAAFAAGRWIGDVARGSRAHRDLRALQERVEDALRARSEGPATSLSGATVARLVGRPAAAVTRPSRPAAAEGWPGPLPFASGAAAPTLGRETGGD